MRRVAREVRLNPAVCRGTLFVPVGQCGIHPLCLLTDGIELTSLKKERARRADGPFVQVARAIEWLEREVQRDDAEGVSERPDAHLRLHNLQELRELQRRHEAGELSAVEDA